LDAILALHPPLSPLLQSREGRTRLNPPHLRPLPQGERKLALILLTKNWDCRVASLLAMTDNLTPNRPLSPPSPQSPPIEGWVDKTKAPLTFVLSPKGRGNLRQLPSPLRTRLPPATLCSRLRLTRSQ